MTEKSEGEKTPTYAEMISQYDHPSDCQRVRADDGLERWAYNQMPKTRDWSDLKLYRFYGTELYQWRGKKNGSVFEDQASEVFAIQERM